MIRTKMQIIEQSIIFMRKNVKGAVRAAVMFCALLCIPFANVDAQTEWSAAYPGETMLWRCQQMTETKTYEEDSHVMNFRVVSEPTTLPVQDVEIYKGQTLLWGCRMLTGETDFVDTLAYPNYPYLDSVYTPVKLKIVKSIEPEAESATICKGDTLLWRCMTIAGTQIAAADTVLTDTLKSLLYPEVDSIRKLNLTIAPPTYMPEEVVTVNVRDTLLWRCKTIICDKLTNGVPLTFTDVEEPDAPCAVIYTLKVNVVCAEEQVVVEPNITLCKGAEQDWHGETLTGDEDKDYEHKERSKVYGCDSVLFKVHVHVLKPVEHSAEKISAFVRDTVLWRCKTIVCDKIVTDSIITDEVVGGEFDCLTDIYTLKLTIGCSEIQEASPETHTICKGATYPWHGQDLTIADTYEAMDKDIFGCDSMHYTLTLNVIEPVEHPVEEISAFVRDTVIWRCKTIVCDRIVTDSIITDEVIGGDPECLTDIYTLKLTIGCSGTYAEAAPEMKTICKGDTYKWHNQDLTTANSYEAMDKDIFGCDSMHYTLTLNVIEPVGHPEEKISAFVRDTVLWRCKTIVCDKIVTDSIITDEVVGGEFDCLTDIYTLKLTIGCSGAYQEAPAETKTICKGATYPWHGQDLTIADTYEAMDKDIFGCDSMHYTLTLNVIEPVGHPEEKISAFVRDTVLWRCKTIVCDKIVTDSIITDEVVGGEFDCLTDIYTLKLTIGCPEVKEMDPETTTICQGDTVKWHGHELFTDSVCEHMYKDIFGCDSVHYTITVEVLEREQQDTTLNLKLRETYDLWRGKHIVADALCNDSIIGDTIWWDNDEPRCAKQIYVLHLNVTCPDVEEVKDTVVYCGNETILWRCQMIDESGDYFDTIPSLVSAECDSVYYSLHLTINKKSEAPIDTVVICEGTEFNLDEWVPVENKDGYNYQRQTYYEQTGCDSILFRMNLIVHKVEIDTTMHATICDSKEYTWRIPISDTEFKEETLAIPEDQLTQTYTFNHVIRYSDTTQCDSARYTLELRVRRAETRNPESDTVCGDIPAGGYEWIPYPGRVVYVVPETAQELTAPVITRRDTARFTPTEKQGIGCDSVYYQLNLYVFRPVKDTAVTDTTLCYSEVMEWRGKTYDVAGTYRDTARFIGTDCDSAYFRLDLAFRALPDTISDALVQCHDAQPYLWHGQTITADGIYWDSTFYEGTQCVERYFKLEVEMLYPKYDTVYYSFCEGGTFMWENHISHALSAEGWYFDTVPYQVLGTCDSMIHCLYLTELSPITMPVDTQYICSGDDYTWPVNGKTYTEFGTYTHTVKYDVWGCDSAYYTLQLEKLAPMVLRPVDTLYICNGEPVVWAFNGKTYTHGAHDYDTIRVHGCDSVAGEVRVIERKTTIATPEEASIYETETYPWRGKLYSEADTYQDFVYFDGDEGGCVDTIYTLILTVLDIETKTVEINDIVCAGDTYEGRVITERISWSKVDTAYTAEGALVSTTTNYHIDVYEVSMPETFMTRISASCGMPINMGGADDALVDYINGIENFAPDAEHHWYISENGGEWRDLDTTAALDGNDTIVAIRCELATRCDTLTTERTYPVSMTAYMWKYELYDFLPIISKYNGTLLMIDIDAVEQKLGWRPAAEDVQWYRQEGEMDNPETPSETDPKDIAMNKWGYYYTPDATTVKLYTYYAIMKYNKELPAGTCGMMARTLAIEGGSNITLNPTVPSASAPVSIGGGDKYNVTILDMFNNKIAQYSNVMTFNAPATSGTYIVQICDLSGQPLAYRTLIVYP